MVVETSLISKKYAAAFLNVFSDQISSKNLDKWLDLANFLKKNKLFYVYLRIPSISYLTKQKALFKVATELKLEKPIIRMIFLLLDHSRIEILDQVLSKIILLYRRKINTKLFKVTSSHDLTNEEKEKIIKFIESINIGGVLVDFEKDEKLIIGIRIQSITFLWERSIAKQLRSVKRSIFKQVGLW
ncbi:MAG: ATP synthase F1 subunit delta [bacterium]